MDARRNLLERFLAGLLLVAALLLVAHRALAPMAETDLFFHLKLGDLIRAQHAIPFRNLFSFTFPDAADPDLAWGFQVLVSYLYAWGGFPAIVIGKSLLIVAAAALAHRASRRAGAGPTASALAIALMICAADQRLVERPHLITFVGLSALSCILGEVERGRSRMLWLVPPLAFLWANFHAGVFLCWTVLFLWACGEKIAGRLRVAPHQIALVLVTTAIAAVFTPAGLRLFAYLSWHTGLGATRIIEEFRHADAWDDPWFFIMATICFAGAVHYGRAQLGKILPSLVVGLLAWRSVRFVAEWAFLSTPLLAITLHAMGNVFVSIRWRRAGAAIAIAGLTAIIVLEHRPIELGLDPDVVPFSGIAFVTEHGLRERLYHDLDVGCYLLWEGWPRYRVFQDARLPAYPDGFHRALDETPLEPAAFDALLRQYGVDAALINDPDINMRSGSFDPEEWALVYRESDALVFARRIPRYEAVIRAYEIPARIRFRFLGGSNAEPLRHPPARSPVDATEWNRRLGRLETR